MPAHFANANRFLPVSVLPWPEKKTLQPGLGSTGKFMIVILWYQISLGINVADASPFIWPQPGFQYEQLFTPAGTIFQHLFFHVSPVQEM
jgi:hypothetical protein